MVKVLFFCGGCLRWVEPCAPRAGRLQDLEWLSVILFGGGRLRWVEHCASRAFCLQDVERLRVICFVRARSAGVLYCLLYLSDAADDADDETL